MLLVGGAVYGAVSMFINGDRFFGDTVTAADLPFHSWPLAGLVLLAMNGVIPTVVVVAVCRRRPWAERGHLVVAGVLALWIVGQLIVVGPISVLQPFYLAYAGVIAALAILSTGGRAASM